MALSQDFSACTGSTDDGKRVCYKRDFCHRYVNRPKNQGIGTWVWPPFTVDFSGQASPFEACKCSIFWPLDEQGEPVFGDLRD